MIRHSKEQDDVVPDTDCMGQRREMVVAPVVFGSDENPPFRMDPFVASKAVTHYSTISTC
jgi:hypothetical protein